MALVFSLAYYLVSVEVVVCLFAPCTPFHSLYCAPPSTTLAA